MTGILPRNRGNRSANRVGATVSRRLRAADWNVSPSARKHKADGIFVSGRGTSVSVLVDLGDEARNFKVAQGIAATVVVWPQVADFASVDPLDGGAYFVRFEYGV